jgi:hypothetical protein
MNREVIAIQRSAVSAEGEPAFDLQRSLRFADDAKSCVLLAGVDPSAHISTFTPWPAASQENFLQKRTQLLRNRAA